MIGPVVPPPGGRVNTETFTVPAEKTSAAGMVAFNCVALTKVVALGLPFHCTAEQGTNEPPVTTSVNVGVPAGTEVVGSDAIVGAGRLVARVIGVVMVKDREFEGPVAVETETDAVPGDAVSVGRIAAVTCVELTNVVTRGIPFQFTVVAPFTKFVPFTVSVIPFGWQYGVDDVEVEDAEMDAIVGNGPGTGLTGK